MSLNSNFHSFADSFFASPTRVRILFSLALALGLLLGAANFGIRTTRPTDQNLFGNTPEGVKVSWVKKGGASDRAGMKVGDVIVSINGQAFDSALEADAIMRASGGGRAVEYVVRRDGATRKLQVVLARYDIGIITIALILAGLLALVTAGSFGLLRPHLKPARLLFATFYTWSLWLLLSGGPIPDPSTTIVRRMSAIGLLASIPLALMLFFYTSMHFPTLRPDILSRRWLTRAYLGLAWGSALTGILGLAVFQLPGVAPVYGVSCAMVALAGVVIMVAYRKSGPPKTKRYDRFIKAAAITVAIAFGGVTIAANVLDINWMPVGQYAMFSLVLIPISYLYTAHRYRLLDYTPVLRRSRVYWIITVIVNILFTVFTMVGVNALLQMEVNLPAIVFTESSIEFGFRDVVPPHKQALYERASLVLVAFVGIISLWRGRGLALMVLARRFHREQYDYKKALSEFSGIVASILDQGQLAQEVLHKLSGLMHLKSIGIAIVDNGSLKPAGASGFREDVWKSIEFPIDSPWLSEIAGSCRPMPLDQVASPEKDRLRGLGATFVVPIGLDNRLLGLVVLGEKRSEDHYRVEDIELLEAAACQTAVALENARLHQETQEQERLKSELLLAKEIQLGALPKSVPEIAGLDIFATSQPAQEVGGDYYDFFKHGSQGFSVVVGDVSGKGTSAALYVSKVQGMMRSIFEYHTSLAGMFVRLNELLSGEMEKQFFITQVGARFDLARRIVSTVRAGHEPVLHFRAADNQVTEISSQGMGFCLGSPAQFEQYLEEVDAPFHQGDVFLFYTDGITDIQDEKGQSYGEARLAQELKKWANRPAGEIGANLVDAAGKFSGGGVRFDDLTICVVRAV